MKNAKTSASVSAFFNFLNVLSGEQIFAKTFPNADFMPSEESNVSHYYIIEATCFRHFEFYNKFFYQTINFSIDLLIFPFN